jgi:hypothetical protein
MPYKDPEKKKAHSKSYYAAYRVQKLDEIKERQAEWYQENKEAIIPRQRRQRREQRSMQGMAIVQRVAQMMTREQA